jgi:hypothetical protein
MPSKWLTAFRAAEPRFSLHPHANSAASADSSTAAPDSEAFRQSRPAEPHADPAVPIGANSANSSLAPEQDDPIGTNGRYWHGRFGLDAMGANSSETLGFQPVQQAIGTIGANGIGISVKTDLPEAVAGVRGSAAPRFLHVRVDALLADPRVAFEERAAIAEFEAGLDCDAAERLAWAEVTDSLEEPNSPKRFHTGPAGDDASAWRAWMRSRIPVWRARGLITAEALRSVWSEAEDEWHRRHGATPDPDRCAGCGEWMLDGPGKTFEDGAVIHFGNPDRLDCLILYGQAWRTAASAGLIALGLKGPEP